MEAFVSLTTNDSYCKGAVVLGQSLRNVETSRKLVILVGRGVSPAARDDLASVWDELVDVDVMSSTNPENLALFSRPELGVTLTKLHCWTLTQYHKCVFMDADTLVLQNVDDLFSRPELSAAPDIGWPDCFNSGVFVLVPSLRTYNDLLKLLAQQGTFDGGDQGLLNLFWSDWSKKDGQHRLAFTDNLTVSPVYTYTAAYKQYGQQARVLHFLGSLKPWHHAFSSEHQQVYLHADAGPAQRSSLDHIKQWWLVYSQWTDTASPSDRVTSKSGDGKASGKAALHTGQAAASSSSPSSVPPQGLAETDAERQERLSRERWEQGRPDYTGDDNIANIEAHLQKMLSKPPSG